MRTLLCILILTAAAVSAIAADLDVTSIYNETSLAGEQTRLSTRIRDIWTKGIVPNLTSAERAELQDVRFEFPLIGASKSPIDFYSGSRDRTVYMPIISLVFFEDLCSAYAWLWANHYSLA